MLLEARGLGEWGEEGSRAKGEEGLEEAGQGVTVLAVTLQQQVVQQGTATSAATGQREIGPGVDYLKRLALTVEIHAQVLERDALVRRGVLVLMFEALLLALTFALLKHLLQVKSRCS